MKLKIIGDQVMVSVPSEMQANAPELLEDIWRDEFANKNYFLLEMTEAVQDFVERAKLNWHILVYR